MDLQLELVDLALARRTLIGIGIDAPDSESPPERPRRRGYGLRLLLAEVLGLDWRGPDLRLGIVVRTAGGLGDPQISALTKRQCEVSRGQHRPEGTER